MATVGVYLEKDDCRKVFRAAGGQDGFITREEIAAIFGRAMKKLRGRRYAKMQQQACVTMWWGHANMGRLMPRFVLHNRSTSLGCVVVALPRDWR